MYFTYTLLSIWTILITIYDLNISLKSFWINLSIVIVVEENTKSLCSYCITRNPTQSLLKGLKGEKHFEVEGSEIL